MKSDSATAWLTGVGGYWLACRHSVAGNETTRRFWSLFLPGRVPGHEVNAAGRPRVTHRSPRGVQGSPKSRSEVALSAVAAWDSGGPVRVVNELVVVWRWLAPCCRCRGDRLRSAAAVAVVTRLPAHTLLQHSCTDSHRPPGYLQSTLQWFYRSRTGFSGGRRAARRAARRRAGGDASSGPSNHGPGWREVSV